MEKILYLVHRIPFPPNKGDKIRSFHLLRYLSKRYQVCLGAFVDQESDWKYVDELSRYCSDVFIRPLSPRRARLKSLAGFWQGKALSLPYYRDSQMQSWVDATLKAGDINRIVCFSSVMAQYVNRDVYADCTRVADFVDIDSDKWLQYSRNKRFPMNWVYRREAERLFAFEKEIALSFDASLFVSPREAELFRSMVPDSADKIDYFNNGVDFSYFDPEIEYTNPYREGERQIVFVGAMDYWANVDAVTWFTREIFPRIREASPGTGFHIVGVNPTEQVTALQKIEGVVVTGAVPDVRPYVAHAALVVAPLRIARGVQNKVLEAMSMSRPIVLTSAAREGIENGSALDANVFDEAQPFADACLKVLETPSVAAGYRDFIEQKYDWDRNLARISASLGV